MLEILYFFALVLIKGMPISLGFIRKWADSTFIILVQSLLNRLDHYIINESCTSLISNQVYTPVKKEIK